MEPSEQLLSGPKVLSPLSTLNYIRFLTTFLPPLEQNHREIKLYRPLTYTLLYLYYHIYIPMSLLKSAIRHNIRTSCQAVFCGRVKP